MTLYEKATYFIAGVLLLLIVGSIGAYHLAGTVPSHPQGIAKEAVFLWAPAVGFPGGLPRRGWWLSCWVETGRDRCRLSDVDGNTEYEGEFVSYGDKGAMPVDQLRIDPEKTKELKVWIGGTLVPLVFLENGKILIPAIKYEEGVRLLQN